MQQLEGAVIIQVILILKAFVYFIRYFLLRSRAESQLYLSYMQLYEQQPGLTQQG